MNRLARSIALLSVAIGIAMAADPVDPACARLQAERAHAQAALAELNNRIEAARRERLAAIDALQRMIREREDAVTTALRELDEARAERECLQRTQRDERPLSDRLARRLAGEGLDVDPRASAADLLTAWPAIEAGVAQRLAELDRALVSERRQAEVLDRHGQPAAVPVWEWGAAQRIALGRDPATRGLLRRLDDGSWQVAGPHLDHDLTAEPGRMVVDVTGRLAATEPQAGGPLVLIARAGPFAWPILVVALLGLVIIADRLWLLWRWHTPRSLVDRLIADLDSDDAVRAHLETRRAAPTTRILREVWQHRHADHGDREQRAGAALVEAEVRLGRGLRLLAVLAAAAPLLGLLGTVTGMITSFRALDLGGGGNAGQLSAGIGEALLTTEFGLIVAVPLLIAHAVFARDAQRRRAQAESAAMRVLSALQPRHENDMSALQREPEHA